MAWSFLLLMMCKRTGDTRFDILVNNAGSGLAASIEETSEEAFDQIIAINLKAPFFIIQQALPRLRNEGRIINLGSAVTRISLPAIPAYSMSKGAINTLTLSLANQLGSRGITINAIQPGFVATDMNAGMLEDPGSRANSVLTSQSLADGGSRRMWQTLRPSLLHKTVGGSRDNLSMQVEDLICKIR